LHYGWDGMWRIFDRVLSGYAHEVL
jgi:hypothetical protein